ncbi:MFS transporter [Curtobacterium sp. VKM Ac-1376]|uniref:MFS transporter n=1 Tax=Curtobacterium sp. VKM Ac-1376 TaxID=123312 RepID=UPI00188B11A8|nr:MFS transporter [Curtobacterium sp. VKM Ac-1376]MBF4615452.1 MFS transporter [Curtobacterium sp. VKM Ac-1376]
MAVVYRRLLADRPFAAGVGSVALSAVALGMIPLSLILSSGESLVAGAFAAGVFGLANAVGVPIQGALMARIPARWVVGTSTGVSCVFMLVVAAAPGSVAQPVFLAGAGVSFPALAAALRASIPRLFSEPEERSGAYALLSVAFQAGLAVGPVAASLLATSATRRLSFVIVAAVIAAAGFLLAFSTDRTGPLIRSRSRSSLPLAGVATFGRLLAIGGLVSMATGSLTVIVPAVAYAVGRQGLAGPVLAALALGEAVGALVFGARPVLGSRRAQLITALALTAIGYAALSLVTDQLALVAVLVFIAGALSSPVTILLSAALDDVVPQRMIASAYGLIVVAAVGGAALGTSWAGLIVGSSAGAAGAAIVATIGVAVAAALAVPRFKSRTKSQ